MAEVVSSNGQVGWTVIMLNDDETKALTHIFTTYGRLMPELDELANNMLGVSND
mgnify:CR=1 FL=1